MRQNHVEFFKEFGRTNPTLPLTDAGNILQGNACRLDWKEVCPKEKDDETYILGNPPYLGYSLQNIEQKKDMSITFSDINNYKKLDYISCWFYRATLYIQNNLGKYCFVTTNSITQGEQVALLWPLILKKGQEMFFAHQSFKWTNNARGNAGVAVVIIGITCANNRIKYLYNNNNTQIVRNISPYLTNSKNIIISSRQRSISKFPVMMRGSSLTDDGNLLLSQEERDNLVLNDERIEKHIKRYVSGQEFLKGISKYCIHITEENVNEAYQIQELVKRFKKVETFRLKSNKKSTQNKAKIPHLFDEDKYIQNQFLLIPKTTSIRREYMPIGYFNESYVPSSGTRITYNLEPWLFGVISSKMHMLWIRAVGGRLKTDYSYSNTLCYNTFPFPTISKQRKEELTQCTLSIIDERLKHSEKTIAQLYDPDKMPKGLREAHHQNDLAVERCYRSTPFSSDEERLEYLFKLYEKMIQEEKDKDTLFAKEKKPRKRK